ncbi:MAG TPA: hypothetical protein VKT77_18495 [Chthonomonadaceae bacterium]|nr:hypothetical protein [Chthonomonadaceae bacterium]
MRTSKSNRFDAARWIACCLALTAIAAWADTPKPAINSVTPLGVPAGRTTTVTIYGEGLAPVTATVKAPLSVKVLASGPTDAKTKSRGATQAAIEVTVPASCPSDTFELVLSEPDKSVLKTSLCVIPATVVEAQIRKPASTFATAMPLPGPSSAVEGQLDADTADVIRFDAHAGEFWNISLLAGRAGSLLDPVLRVRDSGHNTLALSTGDKKRDRQIVFRVPADGAYYVDITDAEARGGAGYNYRVTVIRKP